MPDWKFPPPVAVPAALRQAVGGHPLVAELLFRRGLADPQAARAFLHPDAWQPSPPEALPGLRKAAALLEAAIRRRRRILVWGDFDVDGQTSTALLVETLGLLGAAPAFYIPNRARESHGVHIPALERLLRDPGFDLLLTCDTGVTAHAALAFLRRRGVPVIVTDHHDLGESLPPAEAVVNPKRLPARHPLSSLPGAGVAWKLSEALLSARSLDPAPLLDLAALGIVADVAEQRGDTRYLLQRGLDVLRGAKRIGLRALARAAGLRLERLTEEGIGFTLAPRLNALGRLEDAREAVELLTTRDPARADYLALRLEALNARRRLLTEQVYQAAKAQLARRPELARLPAIVLGQAGWPGGVVGIVASRLVEEYGRPVLLFSLGEDGVARGSARSVAGVHITEAIAAQKDLLLSFGGHPMAAGCALRSADLPAFREGLARTLRERVPPQGLHPALEVDAELPLAALTPETVRDLERLAPFGAGNPQPVFVACSLHLEDIQPLGREGRHRRVRVRDAAGNRYRVLWWRPPQDQPPPEVFDLAYTVRMSTFRGEERVQITWVASRPAQQPLVEVRPAAPQPLLVDARAWPDVEARLAEWLAEADTLVWAEGGTVPGGLPRHALRPARRLVVWSAPPSGAVLRRALARVQPQEVVLVARDPGLDEPQRFLRHLSALVKYALESRSGVFPLERAAAATAQRMGALFAGLAWLAAEGHIRLGEGDETAYTVQRGSGRRRPDEAALAAGQLHLLLEETAQYRRYLRRAALESIFQTP